MAYIGLKLLGRPSWQDLGPLRPIQHLGNILYRKSLVKKTNAAPHLVEKLFIAGTVLWNRIYWKHIKIARQDAILIITREMLEYSNLRKLVLRVQPLSYGWLMVLLANLNTATVYLDYKNLQQLYKTLQCWPSLVKKSALTSTIEFRTDILF